MFGICYIGNIYRWLTEDGGISQVFVVKPLARKIISAGLFASLGLAALGFVQAGNAHAAEAPTVKMSAIAQTVSPGDEVISTGSQFLKVKYRFGAPSGATGAFDCSSFTQYIFKQNGITLPRTSSEQSAKGAKVAKTELEIGDLLFFKDPGRPQTVGHVGVYAGDNLMLHASSSGGVKFSNINSSYYAKNYVTARRVL
jgi:cell wall-associated NlpC family hydrolase